MTQHRATMRLVHSTVAVMSIAVAVLAFRSGSALRAFLSVPRIALYGQARAMQYSGSFAADSGREVVLVFVGGSTCAPSNTPGFEVTVDSIKTHLRTQATLGGKKFLVIGAANDRDLGAALGFLEKFGPFDEVAAGGGWGNTALARFLFVPNARGPAVTPQLVLIERDLQDGRISNERVVTRKVGLVDIRNWADRGARIPGL